MFRKLIRVEKVVGKFISIKKRQDFKMRRQKLGKLAPLVLLSFAAVMMDARPLLATHEAQVIHACVEFKDGRVLRIVAFPQLCDPGKEALVEWNIGGPPGPEGPPGPTGTGGSGRFVLPFSSIQPNVPFPPGQDILILDVPLPAGSYAEAEIRFQIQFFGFELAEGPTEPLTLDGSIRCADNNEIITGETTATALTIDFATADLQLSPPTPTTPVIILDAEGLQITCTHDVTLPGTSEQIAGQFTGAGFTFVSGQIEVFTIETVVP